MLIAREAFRSFASSQLSIDPRTLAVTRVAMAVLLLFDLAKRASVIATWYGNTGLLPNHTFLWQPIRTFHLSFLWMFSHWQEAAVAFVAIALVYVSLLVGYRTRLAQILSLICLISLHVRVDLLSNGGDFVFCTLLWWTVFLPLGERFSIDAILRSLRSPAHTLAPLRDYSAGPQNIQPVVSLAVLAATVQLALIYGLNALHKQGPTWTEGTAIYYLIQQERILTPIGLWAREYLPFVATQVLTYATLVIESILPLLILSPFGRPWTRRIAILLLFGLHINIALISNVGIFSAVMCVYGTLLLTSDDWDALSAWRRRRRFGTGALPFDPPVDPPTDPLIDPPIEPTVAVGWWDRTRIGLRETTVAFLIFVATAQVLHENWALPDALKIRELPRWIVACVSYTRLHQGWHMFSPDTPTSEINVVIRAQTVDGRLIDPIRWAAGGTDEVAEERVAVQPGYDVFWVDYVARIDKRGSYHPPLREWILAHHERTGNPNDRIARFEAYLVRQDSPPPGETDPRNFQVRGFLKWAAPSADP